MHSDKLDTPCNLHTLRINLAFVAVAPLRNFKALAVALKKVSTKKKIIKIFV